ncbi:MAG TPA: hypothetical protein PKC29_13900 [Thermodesulfobacteriota bacterium]|nr:hypothetical protein [Thermodesulfobacteriota bacterium]
MKNLMVAFAMTLLAGVLILSAGCDGDNILAQETPEPEPTNAPGPGGPEGVTTVVSGTVMAPSQQGCNGIGGINTGDTVDIVITSTGATSGNASVTVNSGTGGTIECETKGSEDSVDVPPITNIGCTVTSVEGGISGVKVNDKLAIGINFNFSPLTKEVGIFVFNSACSAAGITSLNADS